MASTPQNNYAAGPRLVVVAPCAAGTVINQGDFVKVSSNLLVDIAAVADTPHGIADFTNPTGSLGDKVTNGVVLRPGPGVILFLPLKSGDTASYDAAIYISSNVASSAQEVSTSSANGATLIGRCREIDTFTGDGSTRMKVEFTMA